MTLVLVVGKFLPLHRGHAFLLDRALEVAGPSGRLHVFVNDRPQYTIPAEVRAEWVRSEYPAARLHVANDPWADSDSNGQAANIRRILGRSPDVIVTSEDWADPVSDILGCTHLKVDPARAAIQIAATDIRGDPLGRWDMLLASARAGLTRRVCLVGAESTGKSTLASALADHYNTVWVPEYGRQYTLDKLAAGTNDRWSTADFEAIAHGQHHAEDAAARIAGPVLFCDTDALTTAVWHERYLATPSPEVANVARRRRYDLRVICGTDIAWAADEIRFDAAGRAEMQARLRLEIEVVGGRFVDVVGSLDQRVTQVVEVVDQLLTADSMFHPDRW